MAESAPNLAEIIRPTRLKPDFVLPFHHKVVDDSVLVTNDFGSHAFLSPDDFRHLIEGTLDPNAPLHTELREKGFIADDAPEEKLSRLFGDRKHFLRYGPTLHAFVLTERCNHGCQYCHSSVVGMDRIDTDMSPEVAERAVDFAFQTTSPGMTIEFQGGEPTANWEVLVHIVEHAQRKNKLAQKALSFSLVTNFSLLDDEKLDFLVENRVQICTSLDGPADLHNATRIFPGGDSHARTVAWIHKVNRRYKDLGLDPSLYRVEALPTITRRSLDRWKDIVDEYVRVGCRAVFLRTLDPFGFAASTRKVLGYDLDAFIEFYIRSVDYIIELNKHGHEVMERLAAIILSKIIAGYEPNYLDLRSPGGAVIGQLAYHPSGNIYTSDEGRMVAAMGDDMFLLGNVKSSGYHEIISGPISRALLLASTSDGHPLCARCAYKPYCGQQPEYNYKTQGSIFGRMPDSAWCRKHMGIFDYLFGRLRRATPEEMRIFERWTTRRSQEHFLQGSK